MTTSLDLGCGGTPRNPFDADTVYGIDVVACPENNVAGVDLTIEPIPHADEYFDFVSAYDLIEHVPRIMYVWDLSEGRPRARRRHPFVDLMSEIWRVLKPGGKFLSWTPAYPHAPAFRDPGHVNIITDETWFYFDDQHTLGQFGKLYGFRGGFRIESQQWRAPWLLTIMVKP